MRKGGVNGSRREKNGGEARRPAGMVWPAWACGVCEKVAAGDPAKSRDGKATSPPHRKRCATQRGAAGRGPDLRRERAEQREPDDQGTTSPPPTSNK
jgi:hypothetical protein